MSDIWSLLGELEKEHKAQASTAIEDHPEHWGASPCSKLFEHDAFWLLSGGAYVSPTSKSTSSAAKISAGHAFSTADLAIPHITDVKPATADSNDDILPSYASLLGNSNFSDDFALLQLLANSGKEAKDTLTSLPARDIPFESLYSVDQTPMLDRMEFAVGLPDEEYEAPGILQTFVEDRTTDDTEEGEGHSDGASAMSLNRKPGAMSDFVRGNSQNVPFAPGGIDIQQSSEQRRERSAQRRANTAAKALDVLKQHASSSSSSSEWLHVVQDLHVSVSFSSNGDNAVLVEQIDTEIDTAANEEPVDDHQSTQVSAEPSSSSSSGIPPLGFIERSERFSLNAGPTASSSLTASSTQSSWNTSSSNSLNPSDSVRSELEELLSGGSTDFWSLVTARTSGQPGSGEPVWARADHVDVTNWSQKVPSPALEFPFDLDRFQKEAIYHLEQNENVFIAAHTSAGKTVVAEYAIALAAKHLTRAIYTSPIKALSNQKYRDFKDTFGDVGLITGDVQVSPEASCLVVTTEILRSMLYKGADLIRDVEWVIFDEVHYVNDLERGVVWEEVIIMLPQHVNLIFLSATVPNTFEFADWVGRTKRKQIWVISTEHRPTPLEHYLAVDTELFKILDPKKTFLTHGYKNAAALFEERNGSNSSRSGGSSSSSAGGRGGRGGGAGGRGGGGGQRQKHSHSSGAAASSSISAAVAAASSSGGGQNQNKLGSDRAKWGQLIGQLKKNDLLPAVVFAFSKKKCQNIADSLTNLDLTSGGQGKSIGYFIDSSLARLSAADRQVPQVLQMRDLLRRGIGVHHGGLLPIIKEIVEILFSRGLIKVLFATETFAMGVNMPARTVVFDKIRKHDGQDFRTLLAGEYIQMSGRAGRRGLDTVGTVIVLCWSTMPDMATLSTMMVGAPTKLTSQFRLTYNMLLNLLRVQDFRVEDMMKRSFSEVHRQKNVPEQQRRLKQAREELARLDNGPIACIFGEPDIEDYYGHTSAADEVKDGLARHLIMSGRAMTNLQPGRVVVVGGVGLNQQAAESIEYAIILQTNTPLGEAPSFTLLTLVAPRTFARVPDVPLSRVSGICKKRVTLSADAKSHYPSDSTLATLANGLRQSVASALPERLPTLDPIDDFKINDLDFFEQVELHKRHAAAAQASKCHTCAKRGEHLQIVSQRSSLERLVQELTLSLSDSNLSLMPEFQQRLVLLQKLDYVDGGKTIMIKGRVAREFNTAACELLATELVFDNTFASLEPAEMVSVLSVLVFQQKSETAPVLPERLTEAREHLTQHANRIASLQNECGLQIASDEYLKETLHFGLMEIAFEWARGMPFAEICALSDDIQEGSIVRCITRLDETCKELRNVARIIGDSSLFAKAEQASALIKRDVVFASSLYIQ